MKKSLQPTDGDIAERNEHARKIFRYISEVARRLDEANGACKTVSDLFNTSIEINRQKLRENCEKLMFADPVLYGHKAQEILWRKGYYEVVTAAKQFHNKDQPSNFLLAHVEAGIGHYQQIIYKMQMEYNINMRGLVDYPILDIEKNINTISDSNDSDSYSKVTKSIQNCLIYIGDLCRYKAELESEWDPTYAARYYLQAACIDRNIGTPYNQLGTLYIGKNFNLDSVYYYVHCLNCHVPFEGVEDNLVGLLDKNNKMLVNMSSDYSATSSPTERVKLFICRFLSLFDNWYFRKESNIVGELSNVTLIMFKDCLKLKSSSSTGNGEVDYLMLNKLYIENETNPQYISSNIVLNVTSICLLCASKLMNSDDKYLFPIKAFTLAFFSQLLENLLGDLEDIGFSIPFIKRTNGFIKQKLRGSELPKKNSSNTHKIVNDGLLKCENHLSNGSGNVDYAESRVQKKKSKLRLRRRKHRKSDSNVESGEESYSDLSEMELNESGDELSLEGETSSDEYCSELDDRENHADAVRNKTAPRTISKNENEVTRAESHRTEVVNDINLNDKNVNVINDAKLSCFFSDNILPSMVLLQAFLENEVGLIKSCGKSGHVLFKTLVDVLNILNVNFLGRHSPLVQRQTHRLLDKFQREAVEIEKYYKMIPLPEDIRFKDVDALKQHQSGLKWETSLYFKSSPLQENAVRIMRLVDFGNFVTTLIPGVCYNRSHQYFFVKYKFLPKKHNQKNNARKFQERKDFKRHSQKQPTKGVHPVTIHNRIHHSNVHNKNNSDTSQMRILGKLWLMNQVRELETQVQSGKRCHNFPPYVVIDTEALCLYTKVVKQLVGARKFIVLVPLVVLQAIDELKKESSGARDAIRWLEAQLQSGSRFLRAQRSQEVAPVTWVKYPKKMSRDMQNFVQIIEFCNHFLINDKSATKNTSSWSGNGDSEIITEQVDILATKGKIDDKAKGENGDSQATNIIVLLTGSKQYIHNQDQNKDFSFSGLAQSAGVSMEFIQDFSLKWKHVLYKNTKKK